VRKKRHPKMLFGVRLNVYSGIKSLPFCFDTVSLLAQIRSHTDFSLFKCFVLNVTTVLADAYLPCFCIVLIIYVYSFLQFFNFVVMFMHSYCYVCSVLDILFLTCQVALFGYPD
jgi:hypothetical protein